MSRVWWFDWAAIVAALLVSAAFGYVALRGVDWASTSSALGQTNYGWIVPALAILGIWTALRAIRWR